MNKIFTKEEVKKMAGTNLRKYRAQRGYTLRELAKKVDYTAGYIGLIEQSKSAPSSTALINLASALNIDVDQLLTNNKKPTQLSNKDPLYTEEDFQEYMLAAKTAYLSNIPIEKLNDAIKLIS